LPLKIVLLVFFVLMLSHLNIHMKNGQNISHSKILTHNCSNQPGKPSYYL
jgi:hypothetical protein